MKKEQIQELTQRFRFTQSGVVLFGLVNGFPVYVPNAGGNVFKIMIGRLPGKEEKKTLNAMLKQCGGKLTYYAGDGLSVAFRHGNVCDFISSATQVLGQAGFYPSDTCRICGGGSCDAAAWHKNAFGPVHNSCLQLRLYEAQSNHAETEDSSANLLPGLLGALLGMIVGTIPSFLTILLMGYIFAILFALMPVCAYYGYRLLGGRMKGKTPLIVSIVAAVAGVFVLNFEQNMYYLMHDMGYSFARAMRLMQRVIGEPAFWSETMSDSISCFIFAALGVLYAWRLISTTSESNLKQTQAVQNLAYRYPQTTQVPEYYSENNSSYL